MQEPTQKQKDRLKRLAQIEDDGAPAIATQIFDLEDSIDELGKKVETVSKEVGPKGDTPSESELLALIQPLIPEPIKGDNYVLTDADRKEIASKIDVPVVEKVIEKTVEVIREIPIVTENVVEVAVKDTPTETRDKLETLKADDRLDSSAIKGLGDREKKLTDELVNRAIGIVDQRTSFLINKVSNLKDQVDRIPTTGGDAVETVVAGTGISVDSTDPQNPVVSSTITQYTDEMAQDAVGNAVGTGLAYDDNTGAISSTITQYTDEQAQDAVGNAVGSGLDYDDTTGAISVDLTETTAVVTDPATQARNTIQSTADVTGLTVKKYASSPTQIQPDAISGTLVGWWKPENLVTGTWTDASGNGYTLTPTGGGASVVTNVINGYSVMRNTASNGGYRNTSGFTITQPLDILMVVKADLSGTGAAGATWVGSGNTTTTSRVLQFYDTNAGFVADAGGGVLDAHESSFAVNRFGVLVAHFDGNNTTIRVGGNPDVTGVGGTAGMTGITLGNASNNLAATDGDIAEVVLMTGASSADRDGVEAYLAAKYNLELASDSQTENLFELQSSTGEELYKITKDGTMIPTLFKTSDSAMNVGMYAEAYPRTQFTNQGIYFGTGAYDPITSSTNGWVLSKGANDNSLTLQTLANTGTTNPVLNIRRPGDAAFQFDPVNATMVVSDRIGGKIVPYSSSYSALVVAGAAGQTQPIQRWENSSYGVLASISKEGWLGIGVTPTAYLHIKAGTATANTAPIKLTSGTLNTTAEVGAIEFLSDAYYGTITTGAERKQFAFTSDIPTTASGTYTPTRSAEANMDANVTMTQAQYMRVGDTVTVSGRFTADPTLTATATSFEITLPVASNIGAVEDVAGTAFCGAIAGMGAEVTGVVANDTAKIFWVATDVTSQTWSYTFTYQVI